ncbi:MAG: aminotransferase [Bacteroidetes bacterium]|jgi:isopenicillin-N epimerase|nr:aminotransferase [Bacteroidota bacterium]
MNSYSSLKADFYLNPDIAFLNFGSFGACPRPIMEEYQRLQLQMERDPVQFIAVWSLENLKRSRTALGNYIGCDADDLVYVPNPSYAMNIIAKSIDLKPGDEVLSTDLEYGAMDRTWKYYCDQKGAKYIRQAISLPVASKEKFLEEFWKGLTPNTKAIFISHITSTTALKLPVKEICEQAKEKGLLTIVDGAHVPGHIPFDMKSLKADIYTGACHKWMLTPKGCSFLYVKKELQDLFDPLVVSWGYGNPTILQTRFLDYHQMQGTRDFTAFLTIPKAIEYLDKNNWRQVAVDCAALARSNYQRFCDLMNTRPLCPLTDEFLGQMCSIPIKTSQPEKLKVLLYEKYHIEIPVMPHGPHVFLRYSINAFNDQKDLDKLYDALVDIKATSDLLLT